MPHSPDSLRCRIAGTAACVLLAGLALPVSGSAQEDRAAQATAAPDVRTVLYLVPRVPVVIRIHVELAGRPLDVAWGAYVAAWFDQLDADGDGVLRGREVARIPTARQLRALGLASPRPGPIRDPDPSQRDQSRADFTSFVNGVCGDPLTVRMGRRAPAKLPDRPPIKRRAFYAEPVDVGQILFEQLDADGDGVLAADEVRWTAALSRFDQDDDDTLGEAELRPLLARAVSTKATGGELIEPYQHMLYLRSSDIGPATVRRLVDRYDGVDDTPPDQQLSAAELGLRPDVFAAYDRNANGRLDRDEISAWLREPEPDLEIHCRLGTQPAVEWTRARGLPLPGLAPRLPERTLIIDRVHLVLAEPSSFAAGGLEQKFQELDRDSNGYLDYKELSSSPGSAGDFSWMDVNSDGKVFLSEFTEFLQRRQAGLEARAELRISDQASQLFELLDSNHDGRLTPRELSAAREILTHPDDHRGSPLSLGELSHRWWFSFTQGVAPTPPSVVSAPADPPEPPLPHRAPVWFKHMDRNHDGEVTLREFLGPLSTFERLDTNHDGALDPGEADQDLAK